MFSKKCHVALNFNLVVLYVIIIVQNFFFILFLGLKQYSAINPVDTGTSIKQIKQRLQRLLSADTVLITVRFGMRGVQSLSLRRHHYFGFIRTKRASWREINAAEELMISCELKVNTAGIESVRTPLPSELGAVKTRSCLCCLIT